VPKSGLNFDQAQALAGTQETGLSFDQAQALAERKKLFKELLKKLQELFYCLLYISGRVRG
jgi:hypothetical protein